MPRSDVSINAAVLEALLYVCTYVQWYEAFKQRVYIVGSGVAGE